MSPEKLSPGAAARAQRDADFAARFGNGARPQAVAPKTDPAAPARSRAVAIRAGLTSWAETRRLIMDARQAEDWIVLGYTSFELYCEGEFSMKSLRLTAEERADAIEAFRSAGMTIREIGAATGTSKTTVSRALKTNEVDLRVPDGTKLPQVEALRQAIEDAAVSKDSFACESCGKKLATGIVRAAQTRCLKCDPERIHFAREVGGPCEACEAAEAETHAALMERTEDASPALGEPVDVDEQASTGTQTAAEGADTTEADGAQTVRAVPEHAFLSGEAPAPDGDAAPSSSGVTRQDLDEEEAVEPPADTPAAATTSLPDGDGNPMPEQSQQPGQDSPPVLGSEGFPGRAETDHDLLRRINEEFADSLDAAVNGHHTPAGVSGGGVAPEEPRPSVEPVELEDGDGSPASSSSSDPDVAGNPAERLLLAVAVLVDYLDRVDVDAVGPLLLGPDVEQLFDHADAITAHIERIGRARFAEMLQTQ